MVVTATVESVLPQYVAVFVGRCLRYCRMGRETIFYWYSYTLPHKLFTACFLLSSPSESEALLRHLEGTSIPHGAVSVWSSLEVRYD